MGVNKRAAASGAAAGRAAASAPPKDAAASEKQPRRTCLHNQLHKTKFCMYHLKGACQYGTDCAFAHSCAELQATPDLRKTRLCVPFMEGHGCEDPTCTFAHGEEELRSTDMFYKKTLCIWNEKGKCRNGDQCRFAHGLTELRASQGLYAGGLLAPEESEKAAPQTKSSRRRKTKAGGASSADADAAEPMKIMPRSMVDSQRNAGFDLLQQKVSAAQAQAEAEFQHLQQMGFMNELYGNPAMASMLLGGKAMNHPGMAAGMYVNKSLVPPPGFDSYGMDAMSLGLASFGEAMGA